MLWGPSSKDIHRLVVIVLAAVTAYTFGRYHGTFQNDGCRAVTTDGKDEPAGSTYARLAPPDLASRGSDVIDVFSDYANASSCGISSLDLHMPFSPICNGSQAVLDAMTGGGRAGFDTPFIPRGCDMRWYSTADICSVLRRFGRIFFIGDSLTRHIVQALYIHLRQDVAFGGLPEWRLNLSLDTRTETIEDCKCGMQVEISGCSQSPVWDSTWLTPANTTNLIACGSGTLPRITYHKVLIWPIVESNITELVDELPSNGPTEPYAMVMNSAWWNGINLTESINWLSQLNNALEEKAPWLSQPQHGRLFTGVTAGNRNLKHELFTLPEHYRVAGWELGMKDAAEARGIDFLGKPGCRR